MKKLSLVPGEGRAAPANFLAGQKDGFELLDQPLARGLLDAAVQASRDDRRPTVNRHAGPQMDLAAVARLGRAPRLQNAAVQFRPLPQPMPAFAPFKADPPKTLLPGQFAHRYLQCFACLVEFQTAKLYHIGRRKRITLDSRPGRLTKWRGRPAGRFIGRPAR